MDSSIYCFIHCGAKIFTLSLPEMCPICQVKIANDFNIMPFRLPCPFKIASRNPCSIVIKPTAGDFLNEYYNSKDLHIGLTTSKGSVVEFSEKGLCGISDYNFNDSVNSEWRQCLVIETVSDELFKHWDYTLKQVCNEMKWDPVTYDENTRNCFTFVLTFLKSLNYSLLSKAAENPRDFCEQYIVPQTTAAGKYISLYRRLKAKGQIVQDSSYIL